MSGERASLAASGFQLPMQDVSNTVGLAFTDNEFLAITKRNQPPLAAEHAHFTDLVHIHQGVSMNTPKRISTKTLF